MGSHHQTPNRCFRNVTGNRIQFEIKAIDRLEITTFGGSDCRAECASELLFDLVQNAPEHFVGRSGGVWFCDSPPGREWLAQNDLAFCTTKRIGSVSPFLPFPCPMFLRWPQVGIPHAEELMRELLSDNSPYENERIFWIGANTHPVRLALASLGSRFPNLLDAEVMEWDRGAAGGQRSKTRQVSLPEHRIYKYLIDCPGYGYSARIKWLLATGRPLFIVERDIVEHWHEEMEPWVHFIPVSKDLSDLFEHRSRLEADPALYESIGKNARAFTSERLNVDARLRDVLETMDRRLEAVPNINATTTRGYRISDGETLHEANCSWIEDFVSVLRGFIGSDEEEIWLSDERTCFEGKWEVFKDTFGRCEADLLATEVRAYEDERDWTWWKSLKAPEGQDPLESGVAALLPLIRLSRAAAEVIVRGIAEGWSGHPEAVIPTLVNRAGLNIEDIGGHGSFTPPERIGKWYDRRTWHWQGPVEHVPGMLHFPVARQNTPLAVGRLERVHAERCVERTFCPPNPNRATECPPHSVDETSTHPRMLYVSPVGGAAADLLPGVMETFLGVGADCWLLQYDDAELAVPEGVRVIRDKGYKWQLALKHLHPDAVADYDCMFFWDDDLGVSDFDPMRFARIMRTNRLDMAQPATQSPHGLSHAITRHRPCPPPWRDPDGVTAHPVVGRLTNFVEIMAPVFTRGAWREFYSYLDPENRSGWGYDYIPLGRKGIVDVMPVVHTRAVQSINGASEAEIRRFLDNQGLFRHAPVEQGWLFEPENRF